MSDGGYEDKPSRARAGAAKASRAPKPKSPLATRIIKVDDQGTYRVVTMALGSEHGVHLHAKAKMLGDGLRDADLHIGDVEAGTCRADTTELVQSIQSVKPRKVEIEP